MQRRQWWNFYIAAPIIPINLFNLFFGAQYDEIKSLLLLPLGFCLGLLVMNLIRVRHELKAARSPARFGRRRWLTCKCGGTVAAIEQMNAVDHAVLALCHTCGRVHVIGFEIIPKEEDKKK